MGAFSGEMPEIPRHPTLHHPLEKTMSQKPKCIFLGNQLAKCRAFKEINVNAAYICLVILNLARYHKVVTLS